MPLADNDSYYFQSFNRNKKSVALRIRTPEGKAILRRLVPKADALYANCRGDAPEKLELTYKHLSPYNEKIVCCFLSGYGMTGPRAPEPAYDYLMQAYAGIMDLTGEPDGPPPRAGVSWVVDFSGRSYRSGPAGRAVGRRPLPARQGRRLALMDGALVTCVHGHLGANCGTSQKFSRSAASLMVPHRISNQRRLDKRALLKQSFFPILVERWGSRRWPRTRASSWRRIDSRTG